MSPISVPVMSRLLRALRPWTVNMSVHIALPNIALNAWALNPIGDAMRSHVSKCTALNQLVYMPVFLGGSRAEPLFSLVTLHTASSPPHVRATYYERESREPLGLLLKAIQGGALFTKVGNDGWTSELLHVQLPTGLPRGGHTILHNIISDVYDLNEGPLLKAPSVVTLTPDQL